ncbi:MAG: hypothetical protein HYS16_00685 [Deltaproteobacteria bacterium]|nr:MAG: hypothetical protein HYS16_00685 [Deltaproteobacteria bacterium]
MKYVLLLLLFLVLLDSFFYNKHPHLYHELTGKLIKGISISNTGYFSEFEGSQFILKFISRNQYEISNISGMQQSIGLYLYKDGHLILKEVIGFHNNLPLEVFLKFTGSTNGIFFSNFLNNTPHGKQIGVFIISKSR